MRGKQMKTTIRTILVVLSMTFSTLAFSGTANYQIANRIGGGDYHQNFGFQANKQADLVNVIGYFKGPQGQDMGKGTATLSSKVKKQSLSVDLKGGASTIRGTITQNGNIIYFTGVVHCPPAGDVHFKETPILIVE